MHEEPASFDAAVAAATQEPLVQALVLGPWRVESKW